MFSFKKLSILALLTAFLVSISISETHAQSKKKSEQPETYLLEGKVRNAQSGEPLNDAEVHIIGKEIKAETGKDGIFTFEELPEGTYTLKVEKDGYKKWKKEVEHKKGLKVILMVKPESSN